MSQSVTKSFVFGTVLWLELSNSKSDIIRSVQIKRKAKKSFKIDGGEESTQNFSGKLMGRKSLGNLNVEYEKLKRISKKRIGGCRVDYSGAE
jgi:hypothetical protein